MDRKGRRHYVEYYIIRGKFKGFTNTGHDTMYFEHTANSQGGHLNKWIPATIKVDDKNLQLVLKDMPFNEEMEITLERGHGASSDICAKLLSINPID